MLLIVFLMAMIWSAVNPRNYINLIGESSPAIVGVILLVKTFRQFRFTFFTYCVILLSCLWIIVGAHYSYARVPLFNEIRDFLGQSRNNFDRVGHLIQGVIPILVTRELLIRKQLITRYKLISLLAFCVCLASTAFYELVEALACWISGLDLDIFLGTQGDMWDSQSDMMCAAVGGLITIFLFRRIHDRLIEKEFPGTFKNFTIHLSESNSGSRFVKEF
jgi:putative membrane protein